MKFFIPVTAMSLALITVGTHAHDGKPVAKKPVAAQAVEETAFGKAGDARKATRTISVNMSDTMRFTPARIAVKQGETVKFVLNNSGKIMHEFVLGTMTALKEHAELMKKHPGMEHDEPYMAHVAPGKRGEIVWHFTQAGDFNFACLIAGHFEAGMTGNIAVSK